MGIRLVHKGWKIRVYQYHHDLSDKFVAWAKKKEGNILRIIQREGWTENEVKESIIKRLDRER